MNKSDNITAIKGIGEKTKKYYEKLEIFTVKDLLEHYPKGYEVYEPFSSIDKIEEGEIVTIEGFIAGKLSIKKIKNLQILNCQVRDATGSVFLTWFNMTFLKATLKMGLKLIFRGKVVKKSGVLVLEQPQILSKEEYYNKIGKLQPVYPLTKGLTNRSLTKSIGQALNEVDLTNDFLPLEIRKKYELVSYKSAIKGIHFPKDTDNMLDARKRIVFEEFFLFALAIHQLKKNHTKQASKFIIEKKEVCNLLIEKLPYNLTNAQKKVWQEIESNLSEGITMNRLVQGDVGSGKTILAVLALLLVAENGYQGAIMVPTEVLARQHFKEIKHLLENFGIGVALLVGSMTAKEKREVNTGIRNKEVQIIVGTHALIQEKVEYKDLALVITDEQHRFGVKQRETFSKKGEEPHMLVMSATPIPRTLAIILYGDLELSILNEVPANRLPIKNCVVNTDYRRTAYGFIKKEVENGRQVYIICPMVEESENIEAENVIEYTEKLKDIYSEQISIGYIHGKMRPKEKNEIMEKFLCGKLQILVSTTVIEVGINVPNATIMMIENAERFGLAQLHQLRGRVGRGSHQSYCIFVTGNQNKETKKRLDVMAKSNDGFYIAEEDLKLRGPGDLFGIRQSGILEFKMADVYQDASILKDAYEAAKIVSKNDLKLLCKKNDKLREKLGFYLEEVFL